MYSRHDGPPLTVLPLAHMGGISWGTLTLLRLTRARARTAVAVLLQVASALLATLHSAAHCSLVFFRLHQVIHAPVPRAAMPED